MSDEIKLRKEMETGLHAHKFMTDPVFSNAVEVVRNGIVELWRSCPIRDKEGQHELKLMDKLLGNVIAHLQEAADTGKLAARQIEEESLLKKAGEKVRKLWRN